MSEEESDVTTASSESSSESEDETIQDIPDKDFFKTLSCLKTKDPRIYDNKVTFFTGPPLVLKKSQISTGSDKHKESVIETSIPSHPKNKFSLKDIDNDSSSEDEMSAFKKTVEEKEQVHEEENDYIQFLKGKKSNIEDKDIETTLKPLHDYWNTKELDENEKFLKDYILNKKYLSASIDAKIGEENLSDDERELEEQAEYEANYNFRFENEENLKLKRFPRTIEGSLRRKNDSRKKKRAEIAQRKKEEKSKKHQDIKKKQKKKLSEIEERLNKLKELTGNVELGFKDEDILEDFDPEKHDKKMNELFNEDYYNEGDEERPVFDDEDESYWDNDNINMDCDADLHEVNQNKLTRTQKKKLRKKKTYQDVLDLAKPAFDPKVHNDFKKYIDEYYSLDCEDFIDDMPCKFKYREVEPNDYGLSIEEILMADDKELNRWASVKKITKRCPGHVEKNEVKIYKKKAQDETLKKKILPSLFVDPEELERQNEGKTNIKPFKEISQTYIEENIREERVIDQNLLGNNNSIESKGKTNKKKRKHNEVDSGFNESVDIGNTEQENHNQRLDKVTSPAKEEGLTIQSGNSNSAEAMSKKKKRRKKKKKGLANNSSENTANQVSDSKKSEQNNKFSEGSKTKPNNQYPYPNGKNNDGKFKNKIKKKFKKRKEGVVNLSDSRLQAYGIKPKQFRSKILYSQKK